MKKAVSRTSSRFKMLFLSGIFTGLIGLSSAQVPANPGFDPSDVYFQAYLEVRSAEILEKEGDFLAALKKYERANDLFDSVSKFYPDWNPKMVNNRREITTKSSATLRAKAGEQFQNERGVMAELEGGAKISGNFSEKDADALVADSKARGVLEKDPLMARRLKEAEAELERLKNSAKAKSNSNEAMRNATRVDDLRRSNETLTKQLEAAENNVMSLRAQLAAAPVESELKSLNQQIDRLEQEREAMSMALRTSRGQHTEALSKIEILSADMEIMRDHAKKLRQTEANLARDLKQEREISNEVVKGQRLQIESLEKSLSNKSKELEEAYGQISSLRDQLEQSDAAYADLEGERDSLLLEKEQMSSLLKLSEAGRIEQLIDQNMGLSKSLREATERVDRLNLDNNATKDDILDALRDLAVAKSQINRLNQEKQQQDQRVKQLTEKLENENIALSQATSNMDREEANLLKDVVRRQLRVQEHRRQAQEVLLDAAKQLGKEDPELKEAMELIGSTELVLSPEEQKLLAEQNVDGEFISPFARDRKAVAGSTTELNQEMESYERAANKAYLAGRLLPTRELFELMVERNPGNVAALCKLGVVQLKLNDPFQAIESFRKAVELEENNSYAHRMLGYSNMESGDMAAAEFHLKLATDLVPTDADAFILLGQVAVRMGNLDKALECFKTVIFINPVASESYYNLAFIYAKLGKNKEGLENYHKALERGATPDVALARKLENKP